MFLVLLLLPRLLPFLPLPFFFFDTEALFNFLGLLFETNERRLRKQSTKRTITTDKNIVRRRGSVV